MSVPGTTLAVIHEEWQGCTKCDYVTSRSTLPLLGNGDPHAQIMIVDDAPTADDVDAGALFGGERGALVYTLLKNAGLAERSVFCTTAVACRPFVVLDATENEGASERDVSPKAEHTAACYPRLAATVYAVDPDVILVFGDKAWKSLVPVRGTFNTAGQAQGVLFESVIPGITQNLRYPTFAFQSLSKILANPSPSQHAPGPTTIRSLIDVSTYLNTIEKNT